MTQKDEIKSDLIVLLVLVFLARPVGYGSPPSILTVRGLVKRSVSSVDHRLGVRLHSRGGVDT